MNGYHQNWWTGITGIRKNTTIILISMGKVKGFLFAVRHREILMTDLGLFRMEDHLDSNQSDIEELFLDIVLYKKTKETILS